jgi:hypothetical protein
MTDLIFDEAATKHPDSIEPYFVVWCDMDGTNSGAAADDGELQGETIVTATWTVPSGLTKVSQNQNAVTINGTAYGVNTVATVYLSGGTDNSFYEIKCSITTLTRTLAKTFILPVSKKM